MPGGRSGSTTARTSCGSGAGSHARTSACWSRRSPAGPRCTTFPTCWCWRARPVGSRSETPCSARCNGSVTGCVSSYGSATTTCAACTAARTCSPCRAGTKGSASRCSRRWCRGLRSCARTSTRYARSPATPPGWCHPTTPMVGPAPSTRWCTRRTRASRWLPPGVAGRATSRGSAARPKPAPSTARRSTREELPEESVDRDRAGGETALLEVALVVVLGRPELLGRGDLGHDRLAEVGLRLLLRLLGRDLLLGRVEEDRRAVLVADVGALPVELGRVVQLPERGEELVVRDLLGVEFDEHRLGVAGGVAAHLLVRGLLGAAAGVPHGGRLHARDLAERCLDLPEASRRERRLLSRHVSSTPTSQTTNLGPPIPGDVVSRRRSSCRGRVPAAPT